MTVSLSFVVIYGWSTFSFMSIAVFLCFFGVCVFSLFFLLIVFSRLIYTCHNFVLFVFGHGKRSLCSANDANNSGNSNTCCTYLHNIHANESKDPLKKLILNSFYKRIYFCFLFFVVVVFYMFCNLDCFMLINYKLYLW